jgi:hypothetical protein
MSEGRITFEVQYRDKGGPMHLDFEPWEGMELPIRFKDELNRRSGVIRIDGTSGSARIVPSRPYLGDLSDPVELNLYFAGILRLFIRNYTFGWSPPPEEMPRYDRDYHASNKYIQGDPLEIEIKQVQSQIIRRLARPEKLLIGGCSNGELVRRSIEAGTPTFGFDVIPNLAEISFPEVQDRLREGSLTHLPYAREDGFDTLAAVDVLEHIPEKDLDSMIEEWLRMDFKKLVLLINLNQFWFPGHITLRPLDWWANRWKSHFRMVSATARFDDLPAVYSNSGLYNQQWTYWERI